MKRNSSFQQCCKKVQEEEARERVHVASKMKTKQNNDKRGCPLLRSNHWIIYDLKVWHLYRTLLGNFNEASFERDKKKIAQHLFNFY